MLAHVDGGGGVEQRDDGPESAEPLREVGQRRGVTVAVAGQRRREFEIVLRLRLGGRQQRRRERLRRLAVAVEFGENPAAQAVDLGPAAPIDEEFDARIRRDNALDARLYEYAVDLVARRGGGQSGS